MSTRLKIHKVNTLPGVLEEDALYITRDSYGSLVFSVTDKNGTVAFSSPDTNAIYQLVDNKLSDSPIINGPRTLTLGQVASYVIINYNSNNVYNLTSVAGDASIEGDTVTYRAPTTGRDAGFFIDTTYVSITLSNPSFVDKPEITSPINGTTEVPRDYELTSSAFSSTGEVDTHLSSSWQIATDELFNNIYLMTNDNVNAKLTYMADLLPVGTVLYARVRHKGVNLGYSDWSDTISFTTKTAYVQKPTFTNLTNDQTGLPAAYNPTLSAFNKISGTGTHASTDWELSTVSDFSTTVVSSHDNTVDLVSYALSNLTVNTEYYIRARYKTDTGSYSEWTNTIHFTTKNTYDTEPVAPSITSPANSSTELGPDLTVTSTAFQVLSGVEVHQSSDWQVATDAGFTNIVYQSMADETNKTNINLVSLPVNYTLYIRVRHNGATIGASDWSGIISLTTKQSYSNSPNTPSISSPANDAVDIDAQAQLVSSAFAVGSGVDTHASTDWQIATDAGFTNIIKSSIADTVNKTTWTPGNLPVDSVLYARIRYTGSYTGTSDWSTVISFTTKQTYVTAPSITNPANFASNQNNSVNITSDAFASTYTGDAHQDSDWQLATDAAFTSIVSSSSADTVNKTSWTVNNLLENTTYYVRIKHRSANSGASDWSSVISFSTWTVYTQQPSITSPTNGATNQGPYVSFASSAFASNLTSQTHQSSDWQVATDSSFNTIVASVTNDVSNKTSWTITAGLPSNVTYYARVRYKTAAGHISNWSTTIILTTKSSYITTPSITSPTNGATNQGPNVTFTSSAFASSVTGETHTSSDWQLATDAGFTNIFASATNDAVNKTSWTVNNLTASTTYYARVRYKGSSSL
jgi:uncharacterized lipoprotein YmbA